MRLTFELVAEESRLPSPIWVAPTLGHGSRKIFFPCEKLPRSLSWWAELRPPEMSTS